MTDETPRQLSAREILSVSAGDPFFELAQEINNLISRRAYELYEYRGHAHGHDGEDWLHAASEILLNVPAEIAETDNQLTIRADVPGFTERDLDVRVAPRSVCITGHRQDIFEYSQEHSVYSERRSNRIFRVLNLPSEVDPDNVDATVSNGVLEVKVLKVGLGRKVPVRAKFATA
jgi:HSP20 family protein